MTPDRARSLGEPSEVADLAARGPQTASQRGPAPKLGFAMHGRQPNGLAVAPPPTSGRPDPISLGRAVASRTTRAAGDVDHGLGAGSVTTSRARWPSARVVGCRGLPLLPTRDCRETG